MRQYRIIQSKLNERDKEAYKKWKEAKANKQKLLKENSNKQVKRRGSKSN